jgi:hypothetical protein
MSFRRWQKLSERMTAKVVLLAEALDAEGTGDAAAGLAPVANVLSLITVE